MTTAREAVLAELAAVREAQGDEQYIGAQALASAVEDLMAEYDPIETGCEAALGQWEARWEQLTNWLLFVTDRLDGPTLRAVFGQMSSLEAEIPTGLPVGDWQATRPVAEGDWVKMQPGCPMAGCHWGTMVTSINTPGGRRDSATDVLALLLGAIEHLREEHAAAYPWEDHAGQDRRVTIQLEPERAERLIELLRQLYSLRARYTEGADALALAEDINNMAERQRG